MKKIDVISLLFILVLVFEIFGCKQNSEEVGSQYQKGLILYLGDPAVDGCGWMVQVNDSLYSPINLDPKFQVESLKVTLNYTVLSSTWKCGWRTPGYKEINIGSIQKQ